MGHVISAGKIQVANKKKDPIKNLGYPANKAEFRSYLELGTLSSKFVHSFARKAAVLNKMLAKGAPMKYKLKEEVCKGGRRVKTEL